MKVIVWAISTLLLAIAFGYSYNKEHNAKMAEPYRCYLSITLNSEYYTGAELITLTRGEIEKLKPGSVYDKYVVSTSSVKSSSAEFTFDKTDNPDLDTTYTSKMTCFGQ